MLYLLSILQARDDNTTEPTMRISIGNEEVHQQQCYTRPGIHLIHCHHTLTD